MVNLRRGPYIGRHAARTTTIGHRPPSTIDHPFKPSPKARIEPNISHPCYGSQPHTATNSLRWGKIVFLILSAKSFSWWSVIKTSCKATTLSPVIRWADRLEPSLNLLIMKSDRLFRSSYLAEVNWWIPLTISKAIRWYALLLLFSESTGEHSKILMCHHLLWNIKQWFVTTVIYSG